MADPLSLLQTDGIIDEVVSRLKSGKEADIYLVQHAGEIVAAKVYKEREARNFRNNAAYREGRQVRNTRTQRAIDKGSRFGVQSAEQEWKAKEFETLVKLHQAAVRVPQPVTFYEGVLLMEAVIDAEGFPAPRLIDAPIPVERAAELYADIRQQIVKILTCDLIHGDLSPFNVLLAWNGPTLIDFPQVVGAAHNRQAESFLQRDFHAIHRFFAQLDPKLHDHAGDGHEIWRAYQRRELTADFVPTPRARPEGRPHLQRPPHDRHQQRRGGHGGPKGPSVSYVGQPEGQNQGQAQRSGSGRPPRHNRQRRRGRR